MDGVALLVFHAFKQSVFEHVAQRDDALEFAVLVNDHEAVHA